MTTIWKSRALGFGVAGLLFTLAIVVDGVLSPHWSQAPILPYVTAGLIGLAAAVGLRRQKLRQPAIGALIFLVCTALPVVTIFGKLLLTGDLM
jgi:hypothetical protein